MIFYLLADHPEPSWGAGMVYQHVWLLGQLGYQACVLHEREPYRLSWCELEVPVRYRSEASLEVSPRDVVVVPEVLAADPLVRERPWRRVVFVQGGFLIVAGLGGSAGYPELGFEAAMVTMPHLARVVDRHFGLRPSVVPPVIAPYFFDAPTAPRLRRVLLAVKEGYREAGIPDAEIAEVLLRREVERRPGWSLALLSGLTHHQVAAAMQTSQFLVNVHSHEAFNATVPEAMAAGCIPVCYEASGGRDFLRPGENAIVFQNQEVFALVERVGELLDRFVVDDPELERLRAGGRATANGFREPAAKGALAEFFAGILGRAPETT